MDAASVPAERLRSHRLTAPAATIKDAAAHMLAVQAQEFWGGRWALGARTRGAPRLSDVDAAFQRGEIVRSWPMRGTLHIVPAADLAWMLAVTRERQMRQAAPRHRELGLDDDVLRRSERAMRAALRGGGRLTRAEVFDVLRGAGVEPAGQRGVHVIGALSLDAVIVQGPVVPRTGGPTREQYFVAFDEWMPDAPPPDDPLAELFVRYIDGHGPASAADFAWWTALPLGTARTVAASAAHRLHEIESGVFVARPRPRRGDGPDVVALPPFDEYYISYADRTAVCAPELLDAVGPGKNGMVRAVLVAEGRIAGVWKHSVAVGRHDGDPVPELLVASAATDAAVAAALERYRRFITG